MRLQGACTLDFGVPGPPQASDRVVQREHGAPARGAFKLDVKSSFQNGTQLSCWNEL
jgi:hypothetical protein